MAVSSIQPVSSSSVVSPPNPVKPRETAPIVALPTREPASLSTTVRLGANTPILALFNAAGQLADTVQADTTTPTSPDAVAASGTSGTNNVATPTANALATTVLPTAPGGGSNTPEPLSLAISTIPEDLAATILLRSRLTDDLTATTNILTSNPTSAGAAASIYLGAAVYRFQADKAKDIAATAATVRPVVSAESGSAISDFGIGNSASAFR